MRTTNDSYEDILGDDPSAEDLHLVRSLERLHRAALPVARDRLIGVVLRRHIRHGAASVERPHRLLPRAARWLPRRRLSPAALVLTLALLVSGVSLVLAASGIINLGTPTGATSPSPVFPLSGFHRAGASLHAFARPELLFISAANDDPSAAERWALVKALDQFGTLANVSTATAPPRVVVPPSVRYYGGSVPTFDLSHATYRSRYLTFVHKDVLDSSNAPYQHLNATEQQLYARYARSSLPSLQHDVDNFRGTMLNADQNPRHRFPLIDVGGYLQTESNVLFYLDLLLSQTGPTAPQGYPDFATFDEVQQSLQTGTPAPGILPTLIPDVNAEANIITALICHADGSRPKSVCGRPTIKQILRHVR
jgi:hypothetical protein